MAQKSYDSTREDYKTPTWIVDKLLAIANIPFFDMDVCCSEENIPARFNVINGLYDGLAIEWYGNCFLNPPFRDTQKWVRKAVSETDKNNTEVYCILPADRLETKYYQEYILQNPHCCFAFLPQKVGFVIPGHEHEPVIPSQKIMIVIFSKRAAELVSNWNYYRWFDTVAFQGEKVWKRN